MNDLSMSVRTPKETCGTRFHRVRHVGNVPHGHHATGVSPARRRCRGTRRGVLLAVVIVCLAVASAVLLAVVKTTVTASRQIQTQAWQTQARWLAESGLDRAAARLATDGAYVGETWRVPVAAFGGVDAGSNATSNAAADEVAAVVKIEVEAVADQPRQRRVRVQADYPDHPEQRARQSRQAVVQLPPEEKAAVGAEPAEKPPAESVPAKEVPIEKSPAESVPVVAPASDSPTNTTEEKP